MATELVYSSFAADFDMAELIEMFVNELSDRVAVLESACSTQRREELRHAAHQLKGAAGGYGFAEVTSRAARVEDCIRDGVAEEEICTAVQELTSLCRRIRAGVPEQGRPN